MLWTSRISYCITGAFNKTLAIKQRTEKILNLQVLKEFDRLSIPELAQGALHSYESIDDGVAVVAATNVLRRVDRPFPAGVANLGSEHAVARIFAVVCNLPIIVGKYNCSR